MERHLTGDVRTGAKLGQAEGRVIEARALMAPRAVLRDPLSPWRGPRRWQGSVLVAAGRRLLGPVAGSTMGVDPT